ncbi:unnamed protein product, partial [Gulo gulo]
MRRGHGQRRGQEAVLEAQQQQSPGQHPACVRRAAPPLRPAA